MHNSLDQQLTRISPRAAASNNKESAFITEQPNTFKKNRLFLHNSLRSTKESTFLLEQLLRFKGDCCF